MLYRLCIEFALKQILNIMHLSKHLPDLQPAQWIWYPSNRVHQNTFVLFRRELQLREKPRKAKGWIVGESRYRLEVNGRRVQWGPAPCDPRHTEADPLELTELLMPGSNTIGATVCFFGGIGDGTWPTGKPGFLFWMQVEYPDGATETIVSDEKWQAHLCRAWKPGYHRRNFFRALQEEFDARKYPYGWASPGSVTGPDWRPAMSLHGDPNRPAVFTEFFESNSWIRATGEGSLRARSIPMLRETRVPVRDLAESLLLKWHIPVHEYFELMTNAVLAKEQHTYYRQTRTTDAADSFEVIGYDVARESGTADEWITDLDGENAAALTFVMEEHVVGFPYFSIEAPEGTTVEVLMQEGHEIGGPALLQTGKNEWARFICREGLNTFECFEFDTLRWLQLHIHGCAGRVRIREVGVRRRMYPWPHKAVVQTSERSLQRLFDACVNALNNSCQETVVDGFGRERQQYCGDCAHQLHGVRMALGGDLLSRRFLTTFSQGMTTSGYFLDCWPGNDRMVRAGQRHFNLFHFGTILDHGVQFFLECFHHYMHTGDLDALREPYPNLLRFADFLISTVGEDGLLPVEDLGMPFVWMDYEAYRQKSGDFPPFTQRRKQCAYNLYVAGAFRHALAPICQSFDDGQQASKFDAFAATLERNTVARFWCEKKRIFVDNLPWLGEEGLESYSDRALATAVLFNQCPGGDIRAAVEMLANRPANMGLSYVANAGWRLWALAKGGRVDIILKEYREIWAVSRAVVENNSVPEEWDVYPDTAPQWSFCAVAPLYVTYHGLAGIRPLEPGFKRVEIRPQLADLPDLKIVTQTPSGPIEFHSVKDSQKHQIIITLPEGVTGELVTEPNEGIHLKTLFPVKPDEKNRYKLPAGQSTTVDLTLGNP